MARKGFLLDAHPNSAVEAGWYEDPLRRHEYRYWNGTTWSQHVADGGVQSIDESGITVRLSRDSGYADSLRAYDVLLNEKLIGQLRDGETAEYWAPAGDHQLRIRIDWAGSKPVTFRAAEGEVVSFAVKSNLRGPRVAFSAFYAVVAPGSWVILERVHA